MFKKELLKLAPQTIAIAALIAVSAGYALLSIAVRLLSEGFSPFTQVYVRLGAALLFAFILFYKQLRFKKLLHIPKKDWLVLLLMGTVGYSIGVYFITLGALTTKLLNVSVIFATIPFFVYFYSLIFLGKKLKLRLLVSVIVSVIGIWILTTKSLIPQFSNFGIGEIYVLLSAATMSWFFIGRKLLSNHLNNREITILVIAIAFLCSLSLALIKGEPLSLTSFGNVHVLIGLLIGAGFNIVATYFENFSFQHLDAVLGSQLLLLENIFALILGFLFYAEFISAVEIIGISITLGSVYYANRYLT